MKERTKEKTDGIMKATKCILVVLSHIRPDRKKRPTQVQALIFVHALQVGDL